MSGFVKNIKNSTQKFLDAKFTEMLTTGQSTNLHYHSNSGTSWETLNSSILETNKKYINTTQGSMTVPAGNAIGDEILIASNISGGIDIYGDSGITIKFGQYNVVSDSVPFIYWLNCAHTNCFIKLIYTASNIWTVAFVDPADQFIVKDNGPV